MFQIFRQEMNWGGRPLILETGKIARQADGAVMATYGETQVLATVVASKKPLDVDFLPLTVNYQEKTFAAGKIPGGFFKREGRPSEKETLVCRLIDRPIRPLFAKGFHNEVQVIITVLSHDIENDADVLSMVATSAALTLSGVPFFGPIGGAKIGYKDGKFILNPTKTQLKTSDLELMVAGTAEGVLMVESEAHELSEAVMLEAVTFGHEAYQPVIKGIIALAEKCAKDPMELSEEKEETKALKKKIATLASDGLRTAYQEKQKQIRVSKLDAVKKEVVGKLSEEGFEEKAIMPHFKELESDIVRNDILKSSTRIDGRKTDQIRPIHVEAGLLTRAHGSALFTRGETQALAALTLGSSQDSQRIDAIDGEYEERFMLHYNFPPYSVGEAGRVGSPGRREIGHGKLAWRAIHPMLPSKEQFPYALRVVSEITESNGSSSMATVCATSLSMMDAGIPLKGAVAGIAMGLIKEKDDFVVLSDILGDEDHLGDMDFKVAGTAKGITSLQMDIKITSITKDIMKIALEQAKAGRMHILGEMNKVISEPRTQLSPYSPRLTTIKVEKDKIREIIGAGGKNIKGIVEASGAKIDIEDDGTVRIMAAGEKSAETAIRLIREITEEPEMGAIYKGTVIKIFDFGAMVVFFGNRAGLVHISELTHDSFSNIEDVVKIDDQVMVKVVGFDDRGRIRLSIKQVQETDQAVNG